MEIERKTITIAELIEGYREDEHKGVTAYGGKLDVRPPYQREYIYKTQERDEVIRTILKKFPINVMYWARVGRNYELMDGQQRTIAICRYAALPSFSVDHMSFENLPDDRRDDFLNYKLDIYVCKGKPSEILDWFKIINIAGLKLSNQEMRNVSYTGSWLASAKIYFSKPDCIAEKLAVKYLNGAPLRQDYLETALKWMVDREDMKTVEDYMSAHQHDENASQLSVYFKRVVDWVKTLFPEENYRREMKGVEWGILYNEFKDKDFDPAKLEQKISALMMDDDVTDKRGIYYYVFDGNERHLNIRAFTLAMKRAAYERQQGRCASCGRNFESKEMEGDHITPWSKGGKTTAENCQMLCKACNRHKSNK